MAWESRSVRFRPNNLLTLEINVPSPIGAAWAPICGGCWDDDIRTNEGTNRPHLWLGDVAMSGNRIHFDRPLVESQTAQALFEVPKSTPIHTPPDGGDCGGDGG